MESTAESADSHNGTFETSESNRALVECDRSPQFFKCPLVRCDRTVRESTLTLQDSTVALPKSVPDKNQAICGLLWVYGRICDTSVSAN
jgi:hypothetical protein